MTAYRIPPRVAHVVSDGEPDLPEALFLMQLPDVAAAVAHLVGRPRHEVAADVESFLAELVSRGLLALEESPA